MNITNGILINNKETYIPYREIQRIFIDKFGKTYQILFYVNEYPSSLTYGEYTSYEQCLQAFEEFVTRFDNYERR